MKKFAVAALFLALSSPALAQQSVQQTGNVTPGHPAMWVTNGVVGDAGPPTRGAFTGIGTTASGPSICASSGPATGPYNQICLGAGTNTGGGISVNNYGGAAGGMTFTENGVMGFQVDANGNLQSQLSLGYGPAAKGIGGSVAQVTSRTTAVTINKPSGQISLFSAAGSATPATFTVNNNTITATDTVILNEKSGTNLYEFFVTAIVDGVSFNITFFTTGGTAVDAPVINFNIIKGVAN
jgi:hypothetical protein